MYCMSVEYLTIWDGDTKCAIILLFLSDVYFIKKIHILFIILNKRSKINQIFHLKNIKLKVIHNIQ